MRNFTFGLRTSRFSDALSTEITVYICILIYNKHHLFKSLFYDSAKTLAVMSNLFALKRHKMNCRVPSFWCRWNCARSQCISRHLGPLTCIRIRLRRGSRKVICFRGVSKMVAAIREPEDTSKNGLCWWLHIKFFQARRRKSPKRPKFLTYSALGFYLFRLRNSTWKWVNRWENICHNFASSTTFAK